MTMSDFLQACSSGKLSLAQDLYKQGRDVNHRDSDGDTPLMRSIKNKHSPVSAWLVKLPQVNVMQSVYGGYTALHKACQSGTDIEIIVNIIERGDSELLNMKGGGRYTPLEYAVRFNHIPAVELLATWPGVDWDYGELQDHAR